MRRYDDDDDRGSSRRGFAAMDPEQQRRIASMGGRASHGGRGRDYDEDDDYRASYRSGGSSRYDDDYERRGSGRGFAGMDPERQREISSMGGRASHGGQGRDWDDDYRSYGERSSRSRHEDEERGFGGRGRDYGDEDDYRSRGSSRPYAYDYERGGSQRGFAGMDPERHREISSMGGRASHGGQGRDWDDDGDRSSFRSGRSSRYEDEDDRGYGSRRGFAGMDPERQREIASMGGRASHGGQGRDWDDDYRSSSRSERSSRYDDDDDRRGGSSRRGFAGMDPERQREIASMGGRASHRYR